MIVMKKFYEKIVKIATNDKKRQKRFVMDIEYIESRIKSCAKEGKRNYTYFFESDVDIDFINAIGKEFSNSGFLVKTQNTNYGIALEISW